MVTKMIVDWCVHVINQGGYCGAGVLMALESMIAPIPSEAVMPPVGILVKRGEFVAWIAILATSLGSITGSLISYFMGYYGGRPLVLSVGKYLCLDREHLEWTEKWFARHGFITIFIGRFIPVVRHLISIPAGVGKMPILPFALYTLVGATIWNSILLYVGFAFATREEQIWEISHRFHIDAVIACILVVALSFLTFTHIQKRKACKSKEASKEAITAENQGV
jgi:membrane protein DedA with SNARE-associated domain